VNSLAVLLEIQSWQIVTYRLSLFLLRRECGHIHICAPSTWCYSGALSSTTFGYKDPFAKTL